MSTTSAVATTATTTSPFDELTTKAKALRASLRKRQPIMRMCVSEANGSGRIHAAWVTWDGTRKGLFSAFADVHITEMKEPKIMLFATHMTVAHKNAPGEEVTNLVVALLKTPSSRAPKALAA
jgi:hypothetical protein